MSELPIAGNLQPRRIRRRPAAAWLVIAGIIAVSVGVNLALRSPAESMSEGQQRAGLLESDFELLAVPHPDTTIRRPDGHVVTASATSEGQMPDGAMDAAESADGSADSDPDERHRQAITGNWHDEYHGKRHLAVRADGTGTMVVEPDGIGKKLFAAKLTFEIEWSLADGRVTMKMLNGEPKSKVQLILKLYGQEAEFSILELNAERMLLLDADGKTRYDWRRQESARE